MAKKRALTIYYDEMSGEGEEINVTKRFDSEPELFQLDIIKDALEILELTYKKKRKTFFSQFITQKTEIGEA